MELDGETNGSTVTYAQAAPTGGKELDRTSSLLLRSCNLLTISLFRFYLALGSRTITLRYSRLHSRLHGVDGVLHRRTSLLSPSTWFPSSLNYAPPASVNPPIMLC